MHKKHMLLMLACCLIPIAGIIAIGALSIPITSVVQVALVLMCPIMMLVMMFTMRDHEHSHHHEPSSAPIEKSE